MEVDVTEAIVSEKTNEVVLRINTSLAEAPIAEGL